MARKTNNAGTQGRKRSRNSALPTAVNYYPTDPAARRRLNSKVNQQHARIPNGWLSDKGAKDCES